MEPAKEKTMFKKAVVLVVWAAFAMIAGCNTLGKKEAKPDHFEKWRAIAEESRGSTPNPRKYDLELEGETAARAGAPAAKLLETREEVKEVRKLPTMPVTMKMFDVSVPVLLRTLARAADLNIMINESVTGLAKINISNIAWDQAFTGLLSTYGLTHEWSGDILRVITVEDLNRDIAMMEAKQRFERSKKEHAIAMLEISKEKEKLDPLLTRIVKVDYADLPSLRANLESYLISGKRDVEGKKGETGEKSQGPSGELRGSILMDLSTNSLILQATARNIREIVPIIERLDRPTEQVLIEAHIVEANSDTARELGIQWGGLALNSSAGGTPFWTGGSPIGDFGSYTERSTEEGTAYRPGIGNIMNFPSSGEAGTEGWQGMTLGLMHQNIGKNILYAQLSALEREGKINILSKPSITTMDHKKATIESGKEVPYQTVEDDEVKVEWKKAVIKLEVTPHVINREVIRLEILTHKDELDWSRTVQGNPTIITKNAETRVVLYNGQTTVIGGLNKEKLQDGEAGVPFLKDIPGLGRLFKSTSKSQEMEELLIFITPHILEERGTPMANRDG